MAAFEAEGEGLASDLGVLDLLASPPALGREGQLVAWIAVQPDMDKGRVLPKPLLKSGSFRAAIRVAIASKLQSRTFSPGSEGARDFRDAETRPAGRAERLRRHALARVARRQMKRRVWRAPRPAS
jgi:hypothetical protein